jgi:phosphatidate cytidylyltransferase
VLRTRVWTALVALPAVLLIVLFAPASLFTAFIGVLTAVGLYEICSVAAAGQPILVAIVALAGGAPALAVLATGAAGWWIAVLVILAMLSLIVRVAAVGHQGGLPATALCLIGGLYVGVLFPYFAILRNAPGGVAPLILMLILVVVSDSGAYFTGLAIGRVKLLPRVSPNKTVEGAIGSLMAATLAGLLIRPLTVPSLDARQIIAVSIAINVLSQLGDLAGSAYKRIAKVKDFGMLFPGHGGLLDRTCSLVFAVVFTYYYFQ